jgi:DNA-binding NarL/FixJ family response regulator
MRAQEGDCRRVFVCDDSFGYPRLVSAWLEESPGVELAGMATTADELLSKLPAARPQVVLLDIMLPDGLVSPELVERVRSICTGVRVVLASAMPDPVLRGEAARTGADAACSKLASREELLALILA